MLHNRTEGNQNVGTGPNQLGISDLSLEISAPVLTSIARGGPMTQQETRTLRDAYLAAIGRSNWRQILIEAAQNLKRGLSVDRDLGNFTRECQYEIKLGSRKLEFDQEVITVGRLDGCDVGLPPRDSTCSRLHAVVFILRNHIIVVDPGSLLGIYTTSRSSGGTLGASTPAARRPLVFSRGETFILQLGTTIKVVFSPKICLICGVNPREILLDCGHFIMCQSCAQNVNNMPNPQCPYCRQENDPRNARQRDLVQTFQVEDEPDSSPVQAGAAEAAGAVPVAVDPNIIYNFNL